MTILWLVHTQRFSGISSVIQIPPLVQKKGKEQLTPWDISWHPHVTWSLASRELRSVQFLGTNHWAAENQWIYHNPVKPQSSQSIYRTRNFQQIKKKTSFLWSLYDMVSFISVAGSLKVLLLMKCSFAPASPVDSLLNVHCSEHCQYFFRPRQDSMPYGVDHEWTMPAFQGVTGQFFREVSLLLSQRDLSFLFSQRSKGGTWGTLGIFSTREPHLRRFSPLYVFYYHPFLLGVFVLFVFLWTSYITLTFLLNMLSLLPGKPHSSPSTNSKPASCFSFSKSQSSLMKTFLMPPVVSGAPFSYLTFL